MQIAPIKELLVLSADEVVAFYHDNAAHFQSCNMYIPELAYWQALSERMTKASELSDENIFDEIKEIESMLLKTYPIMGAISKSFSEVLNYTTNSYTTHG